MDDFCCDMVKFADSEYESAQLQAAFTYNWYKEAMSDNLIFP